VYTCGSPCEYAMLEAVELQPALRASAIRYCSDALPSTRHSMLMAYSLLCLCLLQSSVVHSHASSCSRACVSIV
jgi:hypothetical protein